jgi:soluble lytic murein transglycosylase-like protein
MNTLRLIAALLVSAGLFPANGLVQVVSNEAYSGVAPCWQEAAQRYGVPVTLLKAVAQVESSNRARVVARNTNGSLDIGFMQINDWWLPHLKRYGVTKTTLLDDACVNLNVGAWILKQGIDRYGYNAQGIGAYGAGTDPKKSQVRITYANKVFRALAQQQGQSTNDGLADSIPAIAAVERVQPTQNAVRQSRRQQRAIATNSPPDDGEQLVWSVFD